MITRITVNQILWEADLIGSRISLAIGEFFWAVMLFWPGDTFGRPTYSHMALVMPEQWWGIMFLVSSFLQVFIVITNKMHSTWAWFFAGWNCCLWGYTVWSMLASVYPPPAAIGGEMSLALAAFWIWLRPLILSESNK